MSPPPPPPAMASTPLPGLVGARPLRVLERSLRLPRSGRRIDPGLRHQLHRPKIAHLLQARRAAARVPPSPANNGGGGGSHVGSPQLRRRRLLPRRPAPRDGLPHLHARLPQQLPDDRLLHLPDRRRLWWLLPTVSDPASPSRWNHRRGPGPDRGQDERSHEPAPAQDAVPGPRRAVPRRRGGV